MRRAPLEERLFGNVERLPWSGCWIWMGVTCGKGYRNGNGYGLIYTDPQRGKLKTHRVAWELANGKPVPKGKLVCHSCDVKTCINPAHLWIGTNHENMADAGRKGILSANHYESKKTHCPAGHEYTAANTYLHGISRYCIACRLARRVANAEKNRAYQREYFRKHYSKSAKAVRDLGSA